MKIIRWPGLIAFILIFALLVGGGVLFAESIVQSMIESTLTDINGAKVDIASVQINYSPVSLSVNDIQIADAARPMTNSIQIARARFAMSGGDLLLGKLIIDDMSLTGIRVDTPRKRSGALPKTKKTQAPVDDEKTLFDFDLPDIDLPDVGEALKQEPLKSEKLVDELNLDVDKTRQQWKATRDDIKDQKRWDSLKARYEKIRRDFKGDFAQKLDAIKDAKQLRDDLKKEMERIRNARRQFNTDSERLENAFKAVKAAPKQDIERIKQKYKLDNLNTGNIAELLFGAQAAEYLSLARTWYRRIKPYIESDEEEQEAVRFEGEDIVFREFNPKPGFYVRKVAIDAEIPRGRFAGSMTDLSSDQSVSKKPTRFKLAGQDMRHRDSEELSGEFNYVKKDRGYSQFEYRIKAYQLRDFDISKSKKLALNMSSGLMDLSLSSRIQSGRINGNTDIDFSKVNFKAGTRSSGAVTRMLATAFSDIHRFNIEATFGGNLKDLDMDLKSDLDNQIGHQFKAQIDARKRQFEQDLKARIDKKLREPLAELEQKKQKLDRIKAEVDDKERELKLQLADLDDKIKQEKEIQKQKLRDKKKQKKDELKQKLLKKLKL